MLNWVMQNNSLQSNALPLSYKCVMSTQRESNTWPFEYCHLEILGIEPRTFCMQSRRATTVPYPRMVDDPSGTKIQLYTAHKIIETSNFAFFYKSKYHPKYLHQDIHSVPGPTLAETHRMWLIRNITHINLQIISTLQRLPKWYSTHTCSQSWRSIRCPAAAQYTAKAEYQSSFKVQHTG